MKLSKQEFKRLAELIQRGNGISHEDLKSIFKTQEKVEEWLSHLNRIRKP